MSVFDKIPTLEKMCGCLEVKKGVLYWSILLVILWGLYFIASIVGGGTVGNIVFSVIWSILGIIVYGLVVFQILKDKPKNLLLPALCTSAANVVITLIDAIISFVILNWIGAILLLIIGGITLYYFLGLWTVFKGSDAPPAGGEPDFKQPA